MAQDDHVISEMILASISEGAHESVTIDQTECTSGGEVSGLPLLKFPLRESAVDSAIDPETVCLEISQSVPKFKSLGDNVRSFNDWINQGLTADSERNLICGP